MGSDTADSSPGSAGGADTSRPCRMRDAASFRRKPMTMSEKYLRTSVYEDISVYNSARCCIQAGVKLGH